MNLCGGIRDSQAVSMIAAALLCLASSSSAQTFETPFESATNACINPRIEMNALSDMLTAQGWSEIADDRLTQLDLEGLAEQAFAGALSQPGGIEKADRSLRFNVEHFSNLVLAPPEKVKVFQRSDLNPPALLLVKRTDSKLVECSTSSTFAIEETWLRSFEQKRGLREEFFDMSGLVEYAIYTPLQSAPFGMLRNPTGRISGNVTRIIPDAIPAGSEYHPNYDVYLHVETLQ